MKKFQTSFFAILAIFNFALADAATVYTENFNNVPGWESGWLGQNSNLTNYYGVGGGRGNNPDGLWIGETTINFATPFGSTITQFSIDTTTFASPVTFEAFDMNNNLIYSSQITVLDGALTNPGTYQNMSFNSTDGVSKIEFLGSYVWGNTSIDNVIVTTNGNVAITPIPSAIWLVGSALAGLVGFGRRKMQV